MIWIRYPDDFFLCFHQKIGRIGWGDRMEIKHHRIQKSSKGKSCYSNWKRNHSHPWKPGRIFQFCGSGITRNWFKKLYFFSFLAGILIFVDSPPIFLALLVQQFHSSHPSSIHFVTLNTTCSMMLTLIISNLINSCNFFYYMFHSKSWSCQFLLFQMYPLVNKHSYWTWPFMVDLPIKNGHFP